MKAIRLFLMMALTIAISGCLNDGYYHEPVTIVNPPQVTGLNKTEQQAISYCLGKETIVPSKVELDCSVDGQAILKKIADIVIAFNAYFIEQSTVNKKHNESNE